MPKELELREQSLTSEATLAESDRRSSHEPFLLEVGLRRQLDDNLLGGCSLLLSVEVLVLD